MKNKESLGMSIISGDGVVTVSFYDCNTHAVVAEASASDVTEAVRLAIKRFGTLQEAACAELIQCGLVAPLPDALPKGKPS